jgi:Protein of unknown function (DUF2905)
MESAGKLLLIAAAVLAIGGLALLGLSRLGLHELPGSFRWRSKSGHVSIYAPIGLMIAVSVIGTIVLNLISRR